MILFRPGAKYDFIEEYEKLTEMERIEIKLEAAEKYRTELRPYPHPRSAVRITK